MGRFEKWLSPPRPTKTTAGACQRQGGQYVVSDRASRDEALKIWQQTANAGDKEAQTAVGEIYEKGLGLPPDYTRAAEWYKKAAEQGYARAQVNLGSLYEKGSGVPKDPAAAVKWYRMAAGLPEDIKLSLGPSAKLQELQSEIASLRQKLEEIEKSGQDNREKKQLLEQTNQKLEQTNQELVNQLTHAAPTKIATPQNINFGRYYALVIGNSQYQHFDKLETPQNDVKRIEEILRKKYKFNTTVIINATYKQIQDALYRLSEDLKENDNLLIYYGGHGELKTETNQGYWVPVDGESGDFRKWFSNRELLDYIDNMKAKHVIVIADSCYAGALAMSSLVTFDVSMSVEQRETLIKFLNARRSRSVLAAGGLEPVPEIRDGKYSVFAKAVVEALEKNDGFMEGKQLYNVVAARVLLASQVRTFPQYVYFNGHEASEFFFVPMPPMQAQQVEYLAR